MQRVPAQIATQIVGDPTASPFYRPFAKFSAGVPESERFSNGLENLLKRPVFNVAAIVVCTLVAACF